MSVMSLLQENTYLLVIAMICAAVLVNSGIRALTQILTTHARERSRREIAAYIAEGSLTPEQGERLVRADVNSETRRPM